MSERGHEKWVWIDLEMTGLDPETCGIIEIALIITDEFLNELGEYHSIISQPDELLEQMVPFVKQMHTTNGLIKKVKACDAQLADVESKALALLKDLIPPNKGILAGNSVWQDRRFLNRYMPKLESYLHYRQIDVSSIKVIASAWHPKDGTPAQKVSNHTALADIRASIDELKFYQNRFFA